ncbi:exo-alpha-sialidase, partial [bacterium]|nr:exo-alpha-sialidase [bacterium]
MEYSPPENPRNSEGSFIILNSGAILFAYTQFYSSTIKQALTDAATGRIVAIESVDKGLTWSNKTRVLVENIGEQNTMSVSLLRLRSGKIALFYCVKNSFHDCRPYIQISSDETKSWTEPRPLFLAPGYYALLNDQVIQLKNGRLIVPVYFNRPIYRDGRKYVDDRSISIWYLSDDDGQTWYESETWWAIPVVSRVGLQEPGVVELSDGVIFSWARTDQRHLYGCYSTDQGLTWSLPQPTELVAKTRSPASIKRIPGKSNLLALYNDHSGYFPFDEKERTPLVAAISQDGGKTWPIHKLIESDLDGYYDYTAIHFVDDTILLAYWVVHRSIRIRRVSL